MITEMQYKRSTVSVTMKLLNAFDGGGGCTFIFLSLQKNNGPSYYFIIIW